MNDAILRTIPRAYFDQAQHMLRYAPTLLITTIKPKNALGGDYSATGGDKY
jgi:hypothetical protein